MKTETISKFNKNASGRALETSEVSAQTSTKFEPSLEYYDKTNASENIPSSELVEKIDRVIEEITKEDRYNYLELDKNKTINFLIPIRDKIVELTRQNQDLAQLLLEAELTELLNNNKPDTSNKINGKTIEQVLGKDWESNFANLKGEEIIKEKARLEKLIDEEKAKEKTQQLIKISGALTSNLRSKPSSQVDYMAFVRLGTQINCNKCQDLRNEFGFTNVTCSDYNFNKHSLEECQRTKCKDCEIPIIFRLKDKPNLKKGEQIILTGKWAKSNGDRPSFTCFSYRLLNKNHEQ